MSRVSNEILRVVVCGCHVYLVGDVSGSVEQRGVDSSQTPATILMTSDQ